MTRKSVQARELMRCLKLSIAISCLLSGQAFANDEVAQPAQGDGGHAGEQDVKALDAISVVGTRDSSASRRGQSIRETPQSITVMTALQIEEQNITDLNQALEKTTGVTVTKSALGRPQFQSRGFQISSVQIDGGFPQDVSALGFFNDYDMAQYEQMELLRGADGLLSGTGEPGGVINLLRKRPHVDPHTTLSLAVGSWSDVRVDVDVNLAPSYDGRWRNRVVAATQDREFFYDTVTMSKNLLYAVSEFDISDDVMLTLGGSYEKRDSVPTWYGLPRYSNGDDLHLSRSTYLGASWNRWDFDTKEVFGRLDYDFSEDWSMRVGLTQVRQTSMVRYGNSFGAVDSETGAGPTMASSHAFYSNVQKVADVNFNGKFKAFGLDHSVVFGADWQYITRPNYKHWYGPYAGTVTAVDVLDFDPHAYPEPAQQGMWNAWRKFYSKQSGVYGVARISLTERLRFIGGARYGRFRSASSYDTYTYGAGGSLATVVAGASLHMDSAVTPYGGLTYDLNQDWTLYGSYSTTYKSQSGLLAGPLPGTPLDPVEGTSYEMGVKGALLDKRLFTSFSVYQIRRDNQGVRDADYPIVGSCCWLQDMNVESKGFDAEASGEILPGWSVTAGYTFNDNESSTTNAAYNSVTPRHLLRLWSTAQLTGALSRWRIGMGVSAQSETYVSGIVTRYDETTTPWTNLGSAAFQFTQPGYAIWSARVEYAVNDNWSASLNLNNLLDKVYYQTVGTSASGNYYGDPRGFMFNLRGRF